MQGSAETIVLGKVSVAVLTYRRNEDVEPLLPLLEEQIVAAGHEDVEVLVIDNDPDAGAQGILDRVTAPHARYVHEPLPGIANARNRALDETTDAHVIIFIDDDERPWDTWLSALLAMYRSSGAAAVAGPVIPDYEVAPDPFIQAGGFFVRLQFSDGTPRPAAGSGNLLLDRRVIGEYGLRFNERFGSTGGSDYLFTRDLVRHGGRIVWAERAGVVDKVPSSRMTRRWVLRRMYRVGNNWSRTRLEFSDSATQILLGRLDMTWRGAGRVALGGGRAVLGLATHRIGHEARGKRMAARGLGMISGAWGQTYVEYRRG